MTRPNPDAPHPAERTDATVDLSTTAPEPGTDAAPEEIEADIERTRRDLGQTVETLAGKLDVKGQARRQVDHARERVSGQVDHVRQATTERIHHAKASVTDDRGKPNQTGWIGLAITTAAVAAIVFVVVRQARR
jgi:hypothetical protein